MVAGILAYSLHASYFFANTTREEVTKAAKQDELLYAMNQLELKVDSWLRIHQQESKLLPKPEHRNSDVLASAATMPESCFSAGDKLSAYLKSKGFRRFEGMSSRAEYIEEQNLIR